RGGEGNRAAHDRRARSRRSNGVQPPGRGRRPGADRCAARPQAHLVIDVDLALAFTTGMVATVNPCGFAMLPAYLSFFLGIEDERASIGRALVVGATVTAGFAVTFAVVGLVVSRVTNSVYDFAPWVSLVIGAALLL